jgi:hypothetical protein
MEAARAHVKMALLMECIRARSGKLLNLNCQGRAPFGVATFLVRAKEVPCEMAHYGNDLRRSIARSDAG